MNRSFTALVDDFEAGSISRRQLLMAIAAAVAVPAGALAQEPGRGRGTAPRDTTPLVPPFEATGWKTVWLDHLSYQCVDYKKAAAFYATLMGWKVRSDDGKQALLDIGENSGGIIIRGGLTAPPPAPRPLRPRARRPDWACHARGCRPCSTGSRGASSRGTPTR